jgi:transglutaminase-like putative cysteine protease
MKLNIRHHTEYSYSTPVSASVQYLRLWPRSDPVQRVLSWHIATPGIGQSGLQPWRDGFGNQAHTLVVNTPHDRLTLDIHGQVETTETHGIVPLDEFGPPPEAFLRATPLTAADDAVRDFAGRFQAERARSTLNALHTLTAAIHDTVTYVQGDTHVHSTAGESLALGSGVCQDHAHLFIACCRHWGLPARYVSGYLHTDAEDGRHLATHAWAEALIEHLGWVSFDPSNRQSATHAYVRLAVACDYQGAAPVRGVRRGGGDEELHVTVQVQATDMQQ